jgi:Radical SAM superfamily/B12 binding domain
MRGLGKDYTLPGGMMRVLLVNTNRKADLMAAPPIGLCYVATAARNAGHEVRVLDLCFSGRRAAKNLRASVSSFAPEVLGLSVRNVDNVNMLRPVSYLPEVRELVAQVRRLSAAPVVLGGSGTSLMPEAVLRYVSADAIIVSDGEVSFLRLLDALVSGRSWAGIPGVGLMQNGRFHMTPPDFPPFRFEAPDVGHWVDMKPYERLGGTYNVQTKRGCPHRCIYCTYNSSLEGHRIRKRDPQEVVDEIEEAVLKYRPRTVEFVDSVFNDPPEHTCMILEEIVRRPWKADFTAMGVQPLHLGREMLSLMWQAGFRSFMITPESASDTMLASYRKGFCREHVIQAAEALAQTRFSVWWCFLLGGPQETHATLQETLDFCREYLRLKRGTARHVAQLFFGVRLYPGTPLWWSALREGIIAPDADPIQPLWYVSPELNMPHALEQMEAAAAACPEIMLGYDEGYLVLSSLAAGLCRLLRQQPPYWRLVRYLNAYALKLGLRFTVRPKDLAKRIESIVSGQTQTSPRLVLTGRAPGSYPIAPM